MFSPADSADFSGRPALALCCRKGGGEGISFIPLLAGGKYHFTKDAFLSTQAGIAIRTFQSDGPAFSFVPAIGFNLTDHLNLTANYNAYAQYGYIIGSAGIELAGYFKAVNRDLTKGFSLFPNRGIQLDVGLCVYFLRNKKKKTIYLIKTKKNEKNNFSVRRYGIFNSRSPGAEFAIIKSWH